MEMHSYTQSSTSDRILGTSLAAFSVLTVGFSAFVMGYTLTRTSLNNPPATTNVVPGVVPHEATLWQDVGE